MSRQSSTPHNGANLGFESECWKMADKLRNNMDAAEYKHVVLGLIFLKYISDAFAERHKQSRIRTGGFFEQVVRSGARYAVHGA